MHTLQLSKFFPPVRGGIETVAPALTEGLGASVIRTGVLCADIGMRTRFENEGGYAVERAGSLGNLVSTSMSPAVPGGFGGPDLREEFRIHAGGSRFSGPTI